MKEKIYKINISSHSNELPKVSHNLIIWISALSFIHFFGTFQLLVLVTAMNLDTNCKQFRAHQPMISWLQSNNKILNSTI